MKVAIHQPEFLPWLGFFDKMARVDTYVIFDHVQFKKRYYENRNKLKFQEDFTWVTLPVKSKGKQKQKILDVEISDELNWQRKIFAKINHCASNTPYGKKVIQELQPLIVEKQYHNLIDFNLSMIKWFRNKFNINTNMLLSSELDVNNFTSSNLVLEVCKKLHAKTYLCGDSGKEYLELQKFKQNHVDIEWQNFVHPVYSQPGKKFISHLSSLDFIFNYGPQTREAFQRLVIGENK